MTQAATSGKSFHHVGLTTYDEQPHEDYVPSSKCWVTDPRNHPMKIEYLRYAPDSPVMSEFQQTPHIAYAVDDLEPHILGKEIIIPHSMSTTRHLRASHSPRKMDCSSSTCSSIPVATGSQENRAGGTDRRTGNRGQGTERRRS
jgi:hypothetical protein